jgi:voltage-gated potassium channel
MRRRGLGLYRFFQYAVLIVGLGAMTVMSVSHLRAAYWPFLTAILSVCLGFYAAELAAKAIGSMTARSGSDYWVSGEGVVDCLAVFPIPIALLAGAPHETAWLFGALWVLKLTAVIPGFSMLVRIVRVEARPLLSVLVVFLIVLVLASTALHLLERGAQPERFGSLPMSLWWAVTTLTTTGYGDSVPETFLGRLIAGMVMVSGLGVFGLWTGILATGFAAEHRRREFIRNWDLVTGVPFLRNLDAPAIIELTRLLRRLDLSEHSTVVRRGREGDCMYFIASGEVEVLVEPHPIRLCAGSFFGEFALLDNSPRSATVVTTMPSTFLILDVTDFRAFTAHHPQLAREVALESQRRKTGVQEGVTTTE